MKKVIFAVVAVMLMVAPGYCQEDVAAPKSFGGIVMDVQTAKYTVEAIDKETREVTLKDEAGVSSTVKCGPEVRNFDQIVVGDTLTIDLSQAVSIIVSDVKAEPSRVDMVELDRAELGEKPAGTITTTVDAMATVEDIDYAARTVTLKGALKTMTVKVDEAAVNFDQVKKGDTVNITVIETMAVAVTK